MNKEHEISPMYVILSAIFISCLLISNITTSKLFLVGHTTLTAAVILFPITYIFGDVLTEVYGYKKARLTIWLGFGCNLLMVIIFWITLKLPYPAFWQGQAAFVTVLGCTPRTLVASFIAYIAGSFLNSITLSIMKVKTNGKWLGLRAIVSTIFGEGADSVLFITIAFFGKVTIPVMGTMILAQYVFKVAYEVIMLPITYKVVKALKNVEGYDIYDDGVNYNIFTVGK